MNAESNRCPQCGRVTRSGALDGLCLACVARLSLGLENLPASEELLAGELELELAAPPGTELLPDPPARMPGIQRFGAYELLGEIGRGGMGIVYRARQIGLDRIVAVKMIPFGALASEESVRRFRTEAEAAARLRHPNIVAIHEIGERDGQHYFSMDYVEGATLADTLHDGPWAARRSTFSSRTLSSAI